MTDEALEILMVKVADGEATEDERDVLMAYLATRPELARELQMHKELNSITEGWVSRLEQDLRDDELRRSLLPRIWSTIGVTLVVVGMAVLTGGGVVELMLDPGAPWWVRLGMGGLAGGSVMLLAGLVARRVSQRDPYSEVVR